MTITHAPVSPSRRRTTAVAAAAMAAVVSLLVAALAAPASAAPQDRWSYSDNSDNAKKVIDVRSTVLDTKQKGRYRVTVRGREFIKDRTDIVRVWFDTRRGNAGPEYRVTWYLGRNPAEPTGRTYWTKSDSWNDNGRRKQCSGIRKYVNYRTDVIKVSLPKKCLKTPRAVRWSGMVGQVTDTRGDSIYGYWDHFPAKYRFKSNWVA